MTRVRQISPWYWVILGALCAFGLLSVANLLLGWKQEWMMTALPFVGIATSIYTFRLLWKQSDHPAFHRERIRSGTRTPDK